MTTPIEHRYDGFRPGRLWSLRDMLKVTAQQYITLGQQIADTAMLYSANDLGFAVDLQKSNIAFHLQAMLGLCEEIDLPVSKNLLRTRLSDPPTTGREFKLLLDAIWAELEGKLFLFVPSHRAKYYDVVHPPYISQAFPSAVRELILAGKGIACEMFTASVFHSMRAVEVGLRVMATELKVTFSYPLELAEWGKIVGELEPAINEFKKGGRSKERDEALAFYSEAASQFRHFNNGWRIRAAHSRATFEESQAIKVFDHTFSFFETLAKRLKETP